MRWVSGKAKRYTSNKRKTSLPLRFPNSLLKTAFCFPQVAGDFLQLHLVSCKLWETSCNCIRSSTDLFVTSCNCILLPASCGRLPAIAVGFPQSCVGLPPFSGAFLQVSRDFRTPPEVSHRLWETSGDLRWFPASCARLP